MKVKRKILISTFFLLTSVLGYLLTPRLMPFSMTLFLVSFGVTLLSLLFYFKKRNKNNYLDFDTLFISTIFIIGFFASFFYNQFFYKALFLYDFEYNYLNAGSWLFSAGMNAYFLGGLTSKKRYHDTEIMNSVIRISSKPFFLILVLSMICFIIFGGVSYYKDFYMGLGSEENGIISYLLVLIGICSIIVCSIEFLKKRSNKNYKLHKSYFFIMAIFCCVLLYGGSRTQALILIMPVIGLYALLLNPIKLKLFIMFMIFGIVSMWIVQNLRSSNKVNMSIATPALIFTDLTIPYRSTFVGMAYVDEIGFTYGYSMSAPIIGIIPGMSRILIGENSSNFGSAEKLTNFTYEKLNTPQGSRIGLGTNTIADIYISFGLFGVVGFMLMLGYLVNYLEVLACRNSLYATIILGALIANSVYMARASLTQPFRYAVWSIFIVFLYKTTKYTFEKYQNSYNNYSKFI